MWLLDKLTGKGTTLTGADLFEDVRISPAMANHITESLSAFYAVGGLERSSHISGLPVTITGYMATLVTNEISMSCGTSKRAEFIMEQMERGLLPQLQEAMQKAGAGGQVIVRPMVYGGHIMFDIVGAGRFFPTRFDGERRVVSGFICDFEDGRKGSFVRVESFDYRERERTLTVTNRVFRNRDGVLGGEASLDSVEAWAALAPEVVIHNVDGPLFSVLSMPFSNTVDDSSPLPVSLYANALDTMKEFDRLLGEFYREMHTGKRKRIVEREAIKPRGKQPAPGGLPWAGYEDQTTDLYVVIDPQESHKPFDDYTPALRVEEYIRGLDAALRVIENQCRLSPGTFSIDHKTGAVTATQIISEDKTTYNTCNAIQQRGMKEALCRLMRQCDVLCDLYALAPAGEIEPAVSFGDSIFEDTDKEFSRRMQMVSAGVEKPVSLRMWYYGEDEETALANLPNMTELMEE